MWVRIWTTKSTQAGMPAGVARNRVARGCERAVSPPPPTTTESIYIFVRATSSICVVYHFALVFVLPCSAREQKACSNRHCRFNCSRILRLDERVCSLNLNVGLFLWSAAFSGASPQNPPGSYTQNTTGKWFLMEILWTSKCFASIHFLVTNGQNINSGKTESTKWKIIIITCWWIFLQLCFAKTLVNMFSYILL